MEHAGFMVINPNDDMIRDAHSWIVFFQGERDYSASRSNFSLPIGKRHTMCL